MDAQENRVTYILISSPPCLLFQEVCSQYWPNDEVATYGEFTVIANSAKEGTLTQRSFGLVHQSQVLCIYIVHNVYST